MGQTDALTRAAAWASLYAAILGLILWWILGFIGGFALHGRELKHGQVNTLGLFNWHPLLMTLGVLLLGSEALLAFRSKPAVLLPRPKRKLLHMSLHLVAAALVILATVAAFLAHSVSRPKKPDFSSGHSYLGMCALVMAGLQLIAGLWTYAYPGASVERRAALMPLHRFAGLATYGVMLAAAATGLQEKSDLVKAGQMGYVPGPYDTIMRIPAVLQLLLVALGLAVFYNHYNGGDSSVAGGSGSWGDASAGRGGAEAAGASSSLGGYGEIPSQQVSTTSPQTPLIYAAA